MLGMIVIITGLATLFTFIATPKYTAILQFVFDAKEQSAVNFDAVISGQPQDEAELLSAIEVMQSRALVGRMIDKLGLLNDPEFNDYAPPSIFTQLFGNNLNAGNANASA